MKFNLSILSRAATHSLCPHTPAKKKKKKLAHSINVHIPLKSVFPYSSHAGLYSHHTYVRSLVPPGMLETWLRTLAPYFGKWPCQGSPEMASEAGTLLPFTAGSPRSLFQKIISLFTPKPTYLKLLGCFHPGLQSVWLFKLDKTSYIWHCFSLGFSCSVFSVSALVGVYKVCGEAIEM